MWEIGLGIQVFINTYSLLYKSKSILWGPAELSIHSQLLRNYAEGWDSATARSQALGLT